MEIKNLKLVDAFQTGLKEQMEQLRALVVSGVGTQQQQFRTLEEQLQAFLNFKEKVLSPEPHHPLTSQIWCIKPALWS